MRPHVTVLFLLLAMCSGRDAVRPAAEPAAEPVITRPITDLHFKDEELDFIAANLRLKAERRGIRESSGATRVERLLALEASIGGQSFAMQRVNAITSRLMMNDGSRWAKLRARADAEFRGREDEVAKRVIDLLDRWQRRRLAETMSYLSSNYADGSHLWHLEWEVRFAAFAAERPLDAATWGWLVARALREDVAAQYGRVDEEHGYRFYLELSGLGTHRDARRLFSVPGIAVGAP